MPSGYTTRNVLPKLYPMSSNNNSDHCRIQCRTYDYDRYFAAMTAPADIRRGLLALYAFNYEIASVRERVSETLIGEMRLQWWRDTISEFREGRVREHPVAAELFDAITRFGLPTARFERMLDARTFDLADNPLEDAESFKKYTEGTAGELMVLAASVCGFGGTSADRFAEIGGFWGRVGILRSIRYSAMTGKVYLPKTFLNSAGVSVADIIENRECPALKGVVRKVASDAKEGISRMDRAEKSLRPAIAFIGIAKIYLKRLEKVQFDTSENVRLEPSRGRCQLSVLSTAITGRV
jgi:phytoene/squalene synthetase